MKRLLLLSILHLLFLIPSLSQEWKSIVPLKSTRADVERLLGKPSPDNQLDFYVTYKFETVSVSIRYITEYEVSRCKDFSWMCHCGFPKDTVSEIDVSPKIKSKFSALKIDKSKLHKTILPEDTNVLYYTDDETGIAYWVLEKDDILLSVRYIASSKECSEEYRKRLRQN